VIQQQQRLLRGIAAFEPDHQIGLPVRPLVYTFGARPYCSSSARNNAAVIEVSAGGFTDAMRTYRCNKSSACFSTAGQSGSSRRQRARHDEDW